MNETNWSWEARAIAAEARMKELEQARVERSMDESPFGGQRVMVVSEGIHRPGKMMESVRLYWLLVDDNGAPSSRRPTYQVRRHVGDREHAIYTGTRDACKGCIAGIEKGLHVEADRRDLEPGFIKSIIKALVIVEVR